MFSISSVPNSEHLTFVAPSIPVNVFNRSQVVNEVFMALFEADEDGFPLWNGNLKKLRIEPNSITGTLELQDQNGINAIDIDIRCANYDVDEVPLREVLELRCQGVDVGVKASIALRSGANELLLASGLLIVVVHQRSDHLIPSGPLVQETET